MGTNLFHVGGLGQGLAMKLVNNMLVQVNTVAVAEALVVGVKAGLDPQTIYDVVRLSTGTSYAFDKRVPRIPARDFSPTGTVDISFKDQELETAFAKQLGVPVLLANVSQQVYQMARAAGLGKEDGTAIVKVLERLAGVQVGRRARRVGASGDAGQTGGAPSPRPRAKLSSRVLTPRRAAMTSCWIVIISRTPPTISRRMPASSPASSRRSPANPSRVSDLRADRSWWSVPRVTSAGPCGSIIASSLPESVGDRQRHRTDTASEVCVHLSTTWSARCSTDCGIQGGSHRG
jgi:hypothetical protein